MRQCALKLQDEALLAKLSAGHLIAQEAKYHAHCLASFYNKARDMKAEEANADNVNHGIAFAGLVSYIDEVLMDSLVAPVFKLSDLVNLYSTRLKQLGEHTTGRVHSTKLNNRILSYLPDMTAHKQGRYVVLVMGSLCVKMVLVMLRKACEHDADNEASEHDADNEAIHLASIVRREM